MHAMFSMQMIMTSGIVELNKKQGTKIKKVTWKVQIAGQIIVHLSGIQLMQVKILTCIVLKY